MYIFFLIEHGTQAMTKNAVTVLENENSINNY